MPQNRRKLRAGLAVFLALSLFVCVVTGGASARAPVGQIEFTPHVTDVGATPIPGAVAVPTPGPGQYFEEGDSRIPATLSRHGDDQFGWAEVAGHPGLVLVWVTDDEGTHYVIVDETSDLFLGTFDPGTNTRLDNGIEDYVRQRDELQRQRLATAGEGIGSGVAIGVLGWGLGLCPVTGGGGCIAGVVGRAAVLAANAVRNFIILQGQNADLRDVESNLLAAFGEAVP